jgi:diketogulonate reductase-like aldo/keto reductase
MVTDAHQGKDQTMIKRTVPKSGEELPVIGLGTWQTFETKSKALVEVLERFTAAGGKVIDTSPMYGRAEEVLGALRPPGAFLATKVWTRGREHGIEQMRQSMQLLNAECIDLMQIHNIVDWRTHLATLRRWKADGRVRYIGITHYTTSAFGQLESILREEELDFVQLPLSAGLPDAEETLLPLARDRGVAVLVNRPFEEGTLLRHVRRRELPDWARGYGAESWGELLLHWIVSHLAVTCVIPATRNPEHMRENLRAGEGRLLTMEERRDVVRRLARA